MVTAARVFGGQVGSAAPVFLAFLAVHVLAGLAAVAFAAATVGYQHRRRHRPGDTGHIVGMGTAYVAMLTAFYVDNGPRLPLLDHLPVLAFWLLPSAIGAPVIARAVMRARRPARARPGAAARLNG